jgi:hypothetical protein
MMERKNRPAAKGSANKVAAMASQPRACRAACGSKKGLGSAANSETATPEGFGFDDAGNVYGSWTGKMAVRRWTKS